MPKKITKNEFIKKANEIHHNLYNYDKFIYVNAKTKGIIICLKHDEFQQNPNVHLSGRGCYRCGRENVRNLIQSNKDEFIKKAREVHDDKYGYNKVVYISAKTKAIFICPKHGDFLQSPNNHLNGNGCLKCGFEERGNSLRKSYNIFIQEANKIHNNFYIYNKFIYFNTHIKGIIECPIHGEFLQTPRHHLSGHGCSKCYGNKLSNIEEFIMKANKIHNGSYYYNRFIYLNDMTKGKVTCPKHGDFLQSPNNHLRGQGCPKCNFRISKPEIEFLNYLDIPEENRQIYIKPYKVDGIINNKIYEFLGDFYHGNPVKFNSDDYNEICHDTFGKLYQDTIKKFIKLKERGYDVYYMWENDRKLWNKNKSLEFPLKQFNNIL